MLTLSLTGGWVRMTAMGVLVYDLTGDPFSLGLMGFAQAAPQLVGAPVAGIVVDQVDRRKVLIGVQTVTVILMSLVTLLVATGYVQFWHLLLIGALLGVNTAFDWPGRLSILPALIPREQLPNAVALNATAFNGARVLGPTIAGWLIGGAGLVFSFGFTVVAAIPYALILATLTLNRAPISTATSTTQRPLANIIAGYAYVWNHQVLRGLLSVNLIPIAIGMSYVTMAPAVASDVLGLGEGGLGWLLAANGIGALTGTLLVAALASISNRGRFIIVGVGLFGVLLIGFAMSTSLWFTLPLILVMGLVISFYSTFTDTLIQTNVDDVYRGRVMAVLSTMWGLTPVGGLLAGAIASFSSVQFALAVNGLLVLAYAPVLWFKTPVREIS